MNTNDTQHTGTLISDLQALVDSLPEYVSEVQPRRPAQWQAAKQRPTQFGDNKNVPEVKFVVYEPEAKDDMERDRR